MGAARKITPPKRLQILNLTYKVRFTDDGEMAEAAGWCDTTKQEIVLANDQTQDGLKDTFLHEVFHAIAQDEENVARRLSSGLCLFAKQNPSAWRWFNRL
jgi:hypothetical protein